MITSAGEMAQLRRFFNKDNKVLMQIAANFYFQPARERTCKRASLSLTLAHLIVPEYLIYWLFCSFPAILL